MGKSSAPPPPDYAAAAVAQGQENRDTARFNAGANRVNQVAPQGSSTWTIRPGADLNNPQPGDYIQTTTLSPEQQRIYDRTAGIDESLLDTASRQLARVSQTFDSPIDLSGLPGWRTSGQMGPQPAANATAPRMGAPAPAAPGGAPGGAGAGGAGGVNPAALNALMQFIQGGAQGMPPMASMQNMSIGSAMPAGGSMSYSSGPSAGMPTGFGAMGATEGPMANIDPAAAGGAGKVLAAMMSRQG